MFISQGRDSFRVSILGEEWFSFVLPGTRLFKSSDTWDRLAESCLIARDETLKEYRYLGQNGSVLSNQGRRSSSTSILGTDGLNRAY